MHPTDDDKNRRARIKYWLEVNGMSRKKLAETLSVTEAAINGWLSNRPIPPARWEEIAALFEEPKSSVPTRVVGGVFTPEEVELIKLQAAGRPLEEFVRELVLRQIRQTLGE